jgi:hypothetical protein
MECWIGETAGNGVWIKDGSCSRSFSALALVFGRFSSLGLFLAG